MKRLIQFSLLLFYSTSFGQIRKTTTIELSTGDCRDNQAYSWNGADTIFFYKLPEDNPVYKIIPRQYNQWPIKIKNVQPSNYKLKYKNNYGQEITEQIIVTQQAVNSIKICPDKLLKYPQNTLAKLQERDTVSIYFHSQGCFHTTVLKLTITKEGNRFIARLYSGYWYYTNKKGQTIEYKEGSMLKSVVMTSQNIQDFIRFENELNYAKGGWCTTTDLYEVKSKYLNVNRTDGNCSWDGFYYLKKSLFGEKE